MEVGSFIPQSDKLRSYYDAQLGGLAIGDDISGGTVGKLLKIGAGDILAEADAYSLALGNAIGGNVSGGILFGNAANNLAQNATMFFWDQTNELLGLGIASSLLARLHVKGKGNTSATSSFYVANSAGSLALKIQDDTAVYFGDYFNLIDNTANTRLEIKSGATKLLTLDRSNYKSVAFQNNIASNHAAMAWGGRYGNNTASGENSTAFGEQSVASAKNSTAHGGWGKTYISNQYTHGGDLNVGSPLGYSRLVKTLLTTVAAGVATAVYTIDFSLLSGSITSNPGNWTLKVYNNINNSSSNAPLTTYGYFAQIDRFHIVNNGATIAISAITNEASYSSAGMSTGTITYSVAGKVLTITYTSPTGYAATDNFASNHVIDLYGFGN